MTNRGTVFIGFIVFGFQYENVVCKCAVPRESHNGCVDGYVADTLSDTRAPEMPTAECTQ